MNKSVAKFAVVGLIGFIADSLFFVFFSYLDISVMIARTFSFWVALNVTWLGNICFTFKNRVLRANPWHTANKWFKYVCSCHVSGLVNIGSFYLVSNLVDTLAGFIFGIALGMVCNYLLSRFVVFNNSKPIAT